MSGGLLLADRMFFIKAYLAEIMAHGGHFIVKAKGIINPIIRSAYTLEGDELKRFGNQPLKSLKSKVSKYKALDLEVAWEEELEARLIVTWDAKNKRPRYLLTSLPRARISPSSRFAMPIGCAGRWSSCSRSGRAIPLCTPLIPPKPTSPRD